MRRADAFALVAKHGGKAREGVTRKTDVLVVGSRGYRLMRRVLLGGVAGVLVRTARYPVVVVPGHS